MASPNVSTVLFVGVQNLRRGRVAEILFNAAASKMNLPWKAISRGLTLGTGAMPKDALDFLARVNVRDLLATARKPQPLAEGELESASKIVAFDEPAFRAAAGKLGRAVAADADGSAVLDEIAALLTPVTAPRHHRTLLAV